jgi:hypothetical protein
LYLAKSPLVAIEAVSIMAGFGKQFTSQHYLGCEAVDVPAEFVEALLPGASRLLLRLRSSNQQDWCSPGQRWTTARCTLCRSQ